jgi:aminoglycoside phosphotransferase (APT) family kinase protein
VSEADELAPKLQRAVLRHIGAPGTIHALQRLTGGAIKSTWSFDAECKGERLQLILQMGAPSRQVVASDAMSSVTPHLGAAEDAQIVTAARALGVPAPRVRAVLDADDAMGSGYVTERVEGETLGARILREPRFAKARDLMAGQCGTILARIHKLDPAALPFLKVQDAGSQLAAYTSIVRHYGLELPALEFGLKWVEKNLPAPLPPTVIHGDFRLGNLIVGEEGIRLVLDWEVGQRGDPMQDLGWLCVKTWRFGGPKPVGGFGERADLFQAYEAESGRHVDASRVRFWEVFGSVKWAIMCVRIALRYRDGGEELTLERAAIGRRIEEPLWDFLAAIEGRD